MRIKLAALLIGLYAVVVAVACITTYNRPKITMKDGVPQLEKRPDGCHVDVFEEGQKVPREHLDIGSIVLEWPSAKIKEQGPEGAINTLKAAACEHGAFIVKDLRALSTAEDFGGGLIYEATLATLVENGHPINEKKLADAGTTPEPTKTSEAAPVNRGW
jgi:hypothetical protein